MTQYENEYKTLLVDMFSDFSLCEIEPPLEFINIIEKCISSDFSFDWHSFNREADNINFPCFYGHKSSDIFTENDLIQIKSLISWLFYGLSQWKKEDDSNDIKLRAYLIILNLFNPDDFLYEIIPNKIKENISLIHELQSLTLKFKTNAQLTDRTPLCERESLLQFNKAILNKDWVEISRLLPSFKNIIFHNTNIFVIGIIKLLASLDFSKFCNAFDNADDIFVLVGFMDRLTLQQVLSLGVKTSNPFVELIVFDSIVSRHDVLTKDEENKIAIILEKISNDIFRLKAWMDIFNHYPNLQSALGVFLSKIEINQESIFDIYIDSLKLNTLNTPCRELEQCFYLFNKNATTESRKIMWTKAYTRWSEWKFGINEKNNYLFNISFSLLDFYLIGYFSECLSEEQRNNYQQEIINEMNSFGDLWYKSSTDFTTRWFFLLSKFQIIECIRKGGEINNFYYTPIQYSNNKYFDMLL